MADYKKKGTKRIDKKVKSKKSLKNYSTVTAQKRTDKKSQDLVMKKAANTHKKTKSHSTAPGMKLVMGKKEATQRRNVFVLCICCILLTAVVLFSALTPTGPFEYLQNKFMSMGMGSFPASISGSELLDCYTADSLIYTLSDTHAEVFNKSGKTLFSRQHEFNSPALCVSAQRALIYDIGGRNLYVFNNNDVISEYTSEYDIYAATIGRNGTIAIASKSKGYASQVQVLNKRGKERFVWFSSTEVVNNVAVSNNGNRLAVSTIDTAGGALKSKVYVFKYSSAEPIYEFTYENSVVYSIECVSQSRFCVTTDKNIDFIKWRNGEHISNQNDIGVGIYKKLNNKKSIAVLGSKSDSTVVVYSSAGQVLYKFPFGGSITDISVCDDTVFVLSDSYVYTLDTAGNQTSDMINASGYNRIISLSADSIITLGNFGLNKFSVE